jgi:conjugative relaxase-like TrwC/TraI family protein
MMGLHKLTAGDGYMYLLRQVAAGDDTNRGRSSLGDYYSSKGETPGRWMGRGLASLGTPLGRDATDPLVARLWAVAQGSEVSEKQMKALFGEGLHPNADAITDHLTKHGAGGAGAQAATKLGRPFRLNDKENEFTRRLRTAYRAYNTALGDDPGAALDPEVRAQIRTALARDMFTETYERPPADAQELSGYVARNVRAQTTAVAGYDLTFTPVKSVSTLWALAPRVIAEQIEQCHHQAVTETLAWIEDNVTLSRMGTDGIAQVDTTGLIAAAFTHRDSRAGDPNLHTHVAISNKVQAIGPDGIPRWLALDGQPLHKAKVSASEFYNTRIEALLIKAVGVAFAESAPRPGKRPVREIVGVPAELNDHYSSRSAAIEARVGDLAKQFQLTHGREPTTVEMLALSQQATLDTRAAKHEPRSLGEQRHLWRAQAIEVLGSNRAVTDMITRATSQPVRAKVDITAEWVNDAARKVLTTITETRATWQENHVRAEAQRVLRYADHPAGPEVIDRVVTAALHEHSIALTSTADTDKNEPAMLRRRDGASIYTRHGTATYTSADILAAERRILASAGARGGRTITENSISLAMLEHHANNGVDLNDGQKALVQAMATSGARVQLALAPAGTGKTTAMATLAAAWRNDGGTVIGLAPTAGAAEVLATDLNAPTDTLAKLVQLTGTRGGTPAPPDDPARKWFDTIGPGTLIILDEAGMASTLDLDTLTAHAKARGADVRLIGDDQQLASISAGGVLRDLADLGDTVTLSTVVRFTHPETGQAEAAASLALRVGDPAAIGFYIDHQRVHVGAERTAADMAYEAWAADLAAGRDSILLAPTNTQVAELNERARLDRLATTTTSQPPNSTATITLADGLTASEGDWIATRKNARWLRTADHGVWVKNGHRWVIRTVHDDGSLTVIPLRGKATPVRLPARYVTAYTTLGYASTINAAQGMTAGGRHTEGTCHTVISDQLTRQQLYVAGTRGRSENHFWGSTAEADPHRILTPKALRPPTAVDVLTAILRRDGAQQSAHTVAAAEADPATRLHRAAAMYTDALATAAQHRAGPAVMAHIDTAATQLELTEAQAWPVLRRNLALLAIAGANPLDALTQAAATPLGDAADPAAVVDWRLPPGPTNPDNPAPLHWLAPIPQALHDDPQFSAYLAGRAQLVTDLADDIRARAHTWKADTAPTWARPLLGHRPGLLAEIAVFRAAHDVDPADTRITGPQQYPTRSAIVQNSIHGRLDAELTRTSAHADTWRALASRHDPHIIADPFWPQLAAHLDNAARAGADISALLSDALNSGGPLPTEMPAAALWWRLAGTLAPPTLHRRDTTLRPPWTSELHHLFGTAITEIILTDTAWPGLVAAVTASDWPPADLLAAANEHLRDLADTEHPPRPDQYAQLLTYRIELLTQRAATIDQDIPHPADYADTQQPTPSDQLAAYSHDVDRAADLHEPPPDPLDYHVDEAHDELVGLDFADLPSQRPATLPARASANIVALRARRNTAHRLARQLAAEILGGGGGPAERAAAAQLADLHRQLSEQRPHQHAVARAHAAWVQAEDTAELHRQLLTQLTAAATAAAGRGDHSAAADFTNQHRQLTENTPHVQAAADAARHHRDAAHADLIAAVGGLDNLITEQRIHTLHTQALTADTTTLNDARTQARDLDHELMRAEAATARAFVDNPAHSYQLDAAELDAVRADVEVLHAAEAASPAASYHPPTTAVDSLDSAHRRAVTALTNGPHSLQLLHLHPGADKDAALTAIAETAHHHGHRILALPVPGAATVNKHQPYADTTATLATAKTRLDEGHWTLPRGTLLVIDNANNLSHDELHWITDTASAANAKAILITTDHPHAQQPAATAVLSTYLPHAQHLGDPPRHQDAPATAVQRAEQHLASTHATSPQHEQARHLIGQRDRILDRLRNTISAVAELDSSYSTLDREQDRSNDGLEL